MSWVPHNVKTNPDRLLVRFDEEMARLADAPEEDILVAATVSPVIHFSMFCKIRDEDNAVISPRPNILQLRIAEAYETLKALGVRVRIIVTKPRRAGCSSFVEHIGYHEAMRRPIEGLTIADDKEGSKAAMAKLESYGKFDSFPWGVSIDQQSTTSLTWSNGNKWTVNTARNPDAGAGDTRQFGHMSETSKWPKTLTLNDARTMACAIPTFSGMDTTIISESTPEEAAGWQFDTWDGPSMWLSEFMERWKAGYRPEEQWIKVFAAWYEFEKNCRQTPCTEPEIEEMKATLSTVEDEEIAKYGLTWEQVAWRRETLKNKCQGDEKTLAFYYPSDPVTCWLQSGTARFDLAKLADLKHRAETLQPDRGYLVRQAGGGSVVFQAQYDGSGVIEVFEHPKERMTYLVACDPATGKSQTKGADPDATSILVLRGKYYDLDLQRSIPAKVVARVRAPLFDDDDVVGGHIERLSAWYGGCIVALEVNQGLHILRVLKDAGVPLYKRIVESAKTKQTEEQYGFKLTDANQRRMVIDGLAAAMRNDELDIPCPHILGQMMKFVRKPNGRAEAAPGAHDDDVMALAMGWEIIPSATIYTRRSVRDVDPSDMAKPGRKTGWRVVGNAKQGW
jgi:hypothetical protein